MATFVLPAGRLISKDASYCVAVNTRGRWSHRFYKTRQAARNEIQFLRDCSTDTKAYYGIQGYQLIEPEDFI